MNRRSLRSLIVINVLLMITIAVVVLSPKPAEAQLQALTQYIMIAGDAKGTSNQQVVYVIDVNRAIVAAFRFESANAQMRYIGDIDLLRDLEAGTGR